MKKNRHKMKNRDEIKEFLVDNEIIFSLCIPKKKYLFGLITTPNPVKEYYRGFKNALKWVLQNGK